MDVSAFLRLALDPIRLALLGRAAEGTVDTSDVADAFDVPERAVLSALGKLRSAGLVDDDLQLDVSLLRTLAESLPQAPSADAELLGDGWSPDEAIVLSRFFSGQRLSSIPTSRTKRLVILERLAQEFEPGVRYQEPEVNFTLQMFHADYAALRRYLVDESFLTRADGVYWRTGGRYEPAIADDEVDAPES
ncbi:MAG TPA: DUF2087 domain-containing protein [Acidimicrobiia bacterium]|jgi:hypothetical protein|nr:DUF2087 domain-containing protein [Acidimicrobiia bacterium]